MVNFKKSSHTIALKQTFHDTKIDYNLIKDRIQTPIDDFINGDISSLTIVHNMYASALTSNIVKKQFLDHFVFKVCVGPCWF